jgi:hypothetical protein
VVCWAGTHAYTLGGRQHRSRNPLALSTCAPRAAFTTDPQLSPSSSLAQPAGVSNLRQTPRVPAAAPPSTEKVGVLLLNLGGLLFLWLYHVLPDKLALLTILFVNHQDT